MRLQTSIHDYFVNEGLSLALAESCTGGAIAARLTTVAGASDYFKGGVVCYSCEAKTALLGVPAEMIKQHTAVSMEVTEAMALGAKQALGADYALAITCYASLTDGDKSGQTHIAIASPDISVSHHALQLSGCREDIIEEATTRSLEILLKESHRA